MIILTIDDIADNLSKIGGNQYIYISTCEWSLSKQFIFPNKQKNNVDWHTVGNDNKNQTSIIIVKGVNKEK